MPVRIRVSNLNKRRPVDQRIIKKAAHIVLKGMRRPKALIDITFVGDSRIRVLNRKFMKRDRATDVLSFPLKERSLPSGMGFVGDVYISSDTAARNAKRFGTSFAEELLLYTIHGVLHLLGFSDRTARDKNIIRKLEVKYLNKLLDRKP